MARGVMIQRAVVALVGAVALACWGARSWGQLAPTGSTVVDGMGFLPVAFEPEMGQGTGADHFVAHLGGTVARFASDGLELVVPFQELEAGPDGPESQARALRVQFIGADPS